MKETEKKYIKKSACVVVINGKTGLISWFGTVMRGVVNTHKILNEKPANLRHSLRWSGRFKEHVKAGVMDLS